ncbi:hypothetical protein ACLOJK_037181 [Asimina triloba]
MVDAGVDAAGRLWLEFHHRISRWVPLLEAVDGLEVLAIGVWPTWPLSHDDEDAWALGCGFSLLTAAARLDDHGWRCLGVHCCWIGWDRDRMAASWLDGAVMSWDSSCRWMCSVQI